MFRLLPSFLLGAALCVPLAARPAERYLVDPAHSFASFEYNHWGLSLQRGRFDRTSGSIELDLAQRSGSVTLEIDAASVSTGSEAFDKVMRSGTLFDVAQYPRISFASTRLVFADEQLRQVEGLLTIKDVTRPITLEVTRFACRFMVVYLKRACGANGQVAILRSDYGVGAFAPFVSDEVTLYFSIEGIAE